VSSSTSALETWSGERGDLEARSAACVADAIRARVATAGRVVLGVVGGRSVGGIYAHLARTPLPWAQVHVFLADERLVPVDSPESNFKLVRGDLLAPLLDSGAMPPGNAHPFPLDESRPDCGVGAYDEALRALGGRLDVVVLSAGEDGHTASLFPDHPSVRLDADGFVLVEGSPKPPPRRVSASRRLLAAADLGVLVFFGEEKREALAKLRNPSIDVIGCPSKVLTSMRRGVVVTDLGA